MLRAAFLVLCVFSFPSFASCQDKEPETRTMEAVLSEIRQLRQDLRTAAVATRKAQIVIYRSHVKERLVEQAAERVEHAKDSLAQLETQKSYQREEMKRVSELRDSATNDQQRKQLETYLSQLHESLEALGPAEQELRTKQMELETELRVEQGKMDSLQEELDRLENSLETPAVQASNPR